MSVPAKKRSKTRVRNGRAHHAIDKKNLSVCTNCKAQKLSHRVCGECGFYKGKEVS